MSFVPLTRGSTDARDAVPVPARVPVLLPSMDLKVTPVVAPVRDPVVRPGGDIEVVTKCLFPGSAPDDIV